jgi:hypothetical protein
MRDRNRIATIAAPALLAALCLGPAVAAREDPPAAPAERVSYDPTDRYETRSIEGWSVLVNRGLFQDEPELARRVLELLRHQLYQVARRVPAGPLERLREIRIWVELREPHHSCMAYHPDAGWLRRHGMNPEKARCVEVANAANFLRWTRDQPWMVLHELAHGYHHRFLPDGFENAEIRAAYEEATAAQRYDSVLRASGREVPAYAATNPMEYFAEATEAYFGTNDFFPFVRAELRRHDPELLALLGKLWHDDDASGATKP